MANEETGITAKVQLVFAFPLTDGKWTRVQGEMHSVDGHVHKISFPGFETRSGEGFGITATFNIFENVKLIECNLVGDVCTFVVQNGRVMSIDKFKTGVAVE